MSPLRSRLPSIRPSLARPSLRPLHNLSSSTSTPKPTTGFVTLEKIEEEKSPNYHPANFYPVHIGEILASKYQVASKLAYDASSTTWLCRHLQEKAFFTIKICKAGPLPQNELAISNLLSNADTSYEARKYARYIIQSFEIIAPDGTPFCCLVYPPYGMSYSEFQRKLPGAQIDKEVAQRVIQFVLFSLDFMHYHGVVHTNVTLNAIRQGIVDYKSLAHIVYNQSKHPSARKVSDDRNIYFSQPIPFCDGMPVLSGLGGARLGRAAGKHSGRTIALGVHSAPEVILDMEWDCKVDIWAVGTTIWTLINDDDLFPAPKDGIYNEEQHLAELVVIMGPPPVEFLKRSSSTKCERYWDEQGNWKGSIPIWDQPLETRVKRFKGQDKELLLNLLRKIFRWVPEERPTAEELVFDEFLMQSVDMEGLK
ncbi:protein kinase [Aspergillus sclerotioniger CBS 115572]|uniref:Protein kinase n=1 Tax=Aspergillus sclerotioniger CBS 115572 TaxID=1450535 RepID=A0A317WHI3_9EURO|nr:protein kinase [Aspergillus sclerotioniger CBS 115572]PWY83660.1 protein kinase [Aspergillus sclerotioniger CBS 115572]